MTSHPTPTDARANLAGVWVFILAGLAIIAATLASATLRILSLVNDSAVTFTADLASAPIASTNLLPDADASATDVQATGVTFLLSSIPTAVLTPAILQQVVLTITVCTVIICLIALARNTLRGQIFSRGNTKLAATAGFTGLIGLGIVPALDGIASHEAAFAAGLTDSLTPSIFAVEPLPFIIAAFAIAIVLSAFSVGDRLQRETEGLV